MNLFDQMQYLLGIILGIALIFFSSSFAEGTLRWRQRKWGDRFGSPDPNRERRLVIIVGVGFVIFSLFGLFTGTPLRRGG